MATRDRPADRGRRRVREAFRRLGREHREARTAAGLSLRAAAAASGASRSQLSRFELGVLSRVDVADVAAWCAVVGLDLALRAYPAGDPIRDAAHLGLLGRLRARLHPALRWRTEVPLPLDGDLRAWDAVISSALPSRWRVRVEAETRIADAQALQRRLALKARDDPGGHLVLLVAETRANRRAIATLDGGLREMFPGDARTVLAALAAGEDPGCSAVIRL